MVRLRTLDAVAGPNVDEMVGVRRQSAETGCFRSSLRSFWAQEPLRPNFDIVARTTWQETTAPDATLSYAIASLQSFGGTDLTETLAKIETSLQGVTIDGYSAVLTACGAKAEVLALPGRSTIQRLEGPCKLRCRSSRKLLSGSCLTIGRILNWIF